MSYVEEIEKLQAELAACREANRAIHEQDAANVAKLAKLRALAEHAWVSADNVTEVVESAVVLDILNGDA